MGQKGGDLLLLFSIRFDSIFKVTARKTNGAESIYSTELIIEIRNHLNIFFSFFLLSLSTIVKLYSILKYKYFY